MGPIVQVAAAWALAARRRSCVARCRRRRAVPAAAAEPGRGRCRRRPSTTAAAGSTARAAAHAAERPHLFQYAVGTDSEFVYRSATATSTSACATTRASGGAERLRLLTYRPTKWLEANIEATLKKEIHVNEERFVLAADGEVVPREGRGHARRCSIRRTSSSRVSRAVPSSSRVGRRLYEDPRLFLYDLSMDAVHLPAQGTKLQPRAELGARGMTWTSTWRARCRGIRSSIGSSTATTAASRITAWRPTASACDDWTFLEGRPEIYGLRAFGPAERRVQLLERTRLHPRPRRAESAADPRPCLRCRRHLPLPDAAARAPSITVAYAVGAATATARFGGSTGVPPDRPAVERGPVRRCDAVEALRRGAGSRTQQPATSSPWVSASARRPTPTSSWSCTTTGWCNRQRDPQLDLTGRDEHRRRRAEPQESAAQWT